jgi:hypothetical protein
MKKILFVFAATMVLSLASAQDTIHTTMPLDNYFYNYWPQHSLGDTMVCDYYVGYGAYDYMGIVLSTSNKITIYGFAIGVVVKYAYGCYNDYVWDSASHSYHGVDPNGYYDDNGVWHLIGDSALDESYMDISIMQTTTSHQAYQSSDSVRLHMKYDTVAYYLDQEFSDIDFWRSCPPFPVYEKYFRRPPLVTGKFYLGGVNHSAELCDLHGDPIYPEIRVRGWVKLSEDVYEKVAIQSDVNYFEEYSNRPWHWFFPILTPCPDTNYQTSTRTTTWERYVSLQPNPASDETMVLSSFGIDEVEVFDMAGSRVLRQEASGLSAKLDVKALPRGSYIVRIHTPMGITSRKLILQ